MIQGWQGQFVWVPRNYGVEFSFILSMMQTFGGLWAEELGDIIYVLEGLPVFWVESYFRKTRIEMLRPVKRLLP